ncbi:MAG: AAA family ATPase, partial [Bacteroidota bacterium]
MLTLNKYTTDLGEAIRIAQALAKEYRGGQYGAPHLLKAVLHDDIGLSSLLRVMGIDVPRMREWAELRLKQYPKAGKPALDPQADEGARKVLDVADIVRLKLSLDQINPACVLAALCKPKVGFTEDQLKTFPLTEEELLNAYLSDNPPMAATPSKNNANGKASSKSSGKESALDRFCVDLTQRARDGKIDPIIGRDRETRKVAEILGRRTKPNVIIVGDPGVGKTALVEGFARLIVSGEVPERLVEAQLLELDMGSLIAGAAYKGEIEERLKSIMAELKAR